MVSRSEERAEESRSMNPETIALLVFLAALAYGLGVFRVLKKMN